MSVGVWSAATFYFLVVVNAALLLACVAASRSFRWGKFRTSVANPLLLVTLLGGVSLYDFIYLYADGWIGIFEVHFRLSRPHILSAFAVYTSLFAVSTAAISAAVWKSTPARLLELPRTTRPVARAIVAVTFLPAILAAVGIIASLPAILSGSTNRQLLFLSNPLILLGISAVSPGLAVYMSQSERSRRADAALVCLSVLLVMVTGSRGALLWVLLTCAVAWQFDGRKLPSWLYIPAIPVGVAVLTTLRFFFRESWRYGSVSEFIAAYGGLGRLYFGSSEIGLADAITILLRDYERHARPAFESFIGAILYPVPRALLPFKPVSASGYLTEALSPRRWDLNRSEVLASGYGDLIMQFGVLGALVAVGILMYLWTRGCLRIASSDRTAGIMLLPVLTYTYFVAYRTAFFNVGAVLWPVSATVIAFCILTTLLHRTRDPSSAAPQAES